MFFYCLFTLSLRGISFFKMSFLFKTQNTKKQKKAINSSFCEIINMSWADMGTKTSNFLYNGSIQSFQMGLRFCEISNQDP